MKTRGFGRIFTRRGVLWVAYSHKGHEYRESVAKVLGRPDPSEDDARGLLIQRLNEVRGGRGLDPTKVTVKDVLANHLAHLALVGAKSIKPAASSARAVNAAFGERRVVDLTAQELEGWCTRWLEKRSRGTVQQRMARLRAALALAHERGTIPRIPFVPTIRLNNARQGFFERPQIEQLIAELPDPINDIVRFGYITGWRKSEILGLQWPQVDRRAGRIVLGDTKNGDGRVVPIVGELATLIERRWKARGLVPWVFHRRGRPVKRFEDAWHAACEAAEVPGRLFHDLRRTAVRDMIDAGVHESVAMKISGHRSLAVFRRYNIRSTADMARAIEQTAAYRGAIQ